MGTASSKLPDIERGDLEQPLKTAPLFLAIIFSHFCVFLAERNHDVTASSRTGIYYATIRSEYRGVTYTESSLHGGSRRSPASGVRARTGFYKLS